MAVDVSSLSRMMNGYKKESGVGGGESTVPITRDFLGRCPAVDPDELDLDSQVPPGWEKRLDLKSGKVYLQRCSTSPSSPTLSSDHKHQSNQTAPKLGDLNFPPPMKQPQNLLNDTSLDLKLVPSLSNYQSVCTLDRVKSALERAEKETGKKRSMSWPKSSSTLSNSTSSSKETEVEDEDKSFSPFAAGCPGCLLYVLISKNNPKCPRCHSNVPSPVAIKKPRIDLNMSI